MMHCREKLAPIPKQVIHTGMDGQEALRLATRFESPHLPLPLPGDLMGKLCPIVGVLARIMPGHTVKPVAPLTGNFSACR